MKYNPLISVLFPTYNVGEYLEEAIKSILNQTYQNLEIIIVDDCSTDNTLEIIKYFAKIDNRIQYYRNKKNRQITYCLNKSLKYVTGDYIARMDGDDIALPDRFEKQLEFLEKRGDIGLVGTHELNIDSDGNIVGRNKKITNEELLQNSQLLASPVPHPTWLARKIIFDKVGGYYTHSPAQDYDFLLRMSSLGLKFSNLDIDGNKCRINRKGNTSQTSELKRRKAVNYMITCFKEREKFKSDLHTDERLERYIKSSVIAKTIHRKSQNLLENGARNIKNQKWIKGAIEILFSIIISPYQIQFIFRLVRLKLMIYSYRHK